MGALLQPMERAFPGKMIQGTLADSFGAHIVQVALVPGAEEPGARPQGFEKQRIGAHSARLPAISASTSSTES